MMKLYLLIMLFIASSSVCIAKSDEKISDYSINTLSFTYHAYEPGANETQYFNNKLFLLERHDYGESSYSFYMGSFMNSQNNRCALLGMGKELWKEGRWHAESMYLYAGEFFINAFSHCGDGGVYRRLKNFSGVGFAPYVYYGIRYDFNDYISVKSGVILPGIIVFNLRLGFN